MFSFFRSSKKSSPAESPPSSSDASGAGPSIGADDYVMIEQRGHHPPSDPAFSMGGGSMYPSLGPGGEMLPSGHQRDAIHRQQSEVFSYLQGVPFKLSPLIRSAGDANPTEVWGFEVDQILANMTRAMDMAAED